MAMTYQRETSYKTHLRHQLHPISVGQTWDTYFQRCKWDVEGSLINGICVKNLK